MEDAAAALDGLPGIFYDAAELEGEGLFTDDIVCALLGGADDLGGAGESCGEDDEDVWILCAELGEELDAIEWLKGDVCDDDLDGSFLADFDSIGGIIAAQDTHALGDEVLGGPIKVVVIWVNEEEGAFGKFGCHRREKRVN